MLKEFKVINATVPMKSDDPLIKFTLMPNARYKGTIRFTDGEDDNIMTMSYWQEDYFHFGETTF